MSKAKTPTKTPKPAAVTLTNAEWLELGDISAALDSFVKLFEESSETDARHMALLKMVGSQLFQLYDKVNSRPA